MQLVDILRVEDDPETDSICACGSNLARRVRCVDCSPAVGPQCEECFVGTHRDGLWLHWAKVRTEEGLWERRDISHFGFHPQLGHAGGDCPSPLPSRHMDIVTVSGVHSMHLRLCGCHGEAEGTQLLRAALVSLDKPESLTPQEFS